MDRVAPSRSIISLISKKKSQYLLVSASVWAFSALRMSLARSRTQAAGSSFSTASSASCFCRAAELILAISRSWASPRRPLDPSSVTSASSRWSARTLSTWYLESPFPCSRE